MTVKVKSFYLFQERTRQVDLNILYENRQTEKDQVVSHIHLNIEVSRHLQEGGQRAVQSALWFVLLSWWWVFMCCSFPKTPVWW